MEDSERVLVAWGIDFLAAIDVIDFKLHQMKIKLKKMTGPPTTVLFCPVCNAEFCESNMDSVLFDGTSGEALCPSRRPACTGQVLVDKEDIKPSHELANYAADIINKQTHTLCQLLRDTYGATPPLYEWPMAQPEAVQDARLVADDEVLGLPDLRPQVPWFSSSSAGASSSSGVVGETEPEDDGDIDFVNQYFASLAATKVAGVPAVPAIPLPDGFEMEDDWEEATVTVNGVEKLVSDVTEEDQMAMTEEEHQLFWKICHE